MFGVARILEHAKPLYLQVTSTTHAKMSPMSLLKLTVKGQRLIHAMPWDRVHHRLCRTCTTTPEW